MTLVAELRIDEMGWSHGKAAIENSVTSLEGVERVEMDLATKKVIVSYDDNKATLLDIKQAILEEGYTVVEI